MHRMRCLVNLLYIQHPQVHSTSAKLLAEQALGLRTVLMAEELVAMPVDQDAD